LITLLTGAPGAGKTAQLVEWLRTLYADRPLYVHGLNGLTLPHTEVDASRWHLDVPDGAILVVDEVQQVWRPRGPGHGASEAVKALETHRHRGIDVFLTTQKPNLVDANVRGLVGRHVHLRDTGWLGRYQYEWPEVSENLAWKTCPLKRKFKLPKAAFEYYKSAVEHTTVQKGRSWMPLITAGLCVSGVALAFMVYRSITNHTAPKVAAAPAAASGLLPEGSGAPRAAQAASAPAWPVYDSTPVRDSGQAEPYSARAFQLEGTYKVGRKIFATFGLVVDGQRVATVSLDALVRAGYSFTEFGPCAVSLRYRQVERLVTCGHRVDVELARPAFGGESRGRQDTPASPAPLL
jgi:zona occludens toxin